MSAQCEEMELLYLSSAIVRPFFQVYLYRIMNTIL